MRETFRKSQDEHDFLEISNKKLSDTIALLRQQEQYLDKQLEDSMVEYFSYEEHKKQLIQELEEATATLKKLVGEKTQKKPLKEAYSIPEETAKSLPLVNPFN